MILLVYDVCLMVVCVEINMTLPSYIHVQTRGDVSVGSIGLARVAHDAVLLAPINSRRGCMCVFVCVSTSPTSKLLS